jgi:hypothetical protein
MAKQKTVSDGTEPSIVSPQETACQNSLQTFGCRCLGDRIDVRPVSFEPQQTDRFQRIADQRS